MAFPTVESVTPSTFTSDTTAHAVSMPATCNVGDLKLVLFSNDGGDAVTTPSGWTSLYSAASSSLVRGGAYARVHADGDPSTVDFVTSGAERAAAQCFRISGWHGEISGGVEAATPSTTTTAAPDSTGLTPSWGSADSLWIAVVATSSASTLTSAPSGYSDSVTTNSGSTTNGAQQYSARKTATASSDDPGSWVFSASQPNIFSTIAVRGSAAATLTPPTGSISATGNAPTADSTKVVTPGLVSAAGSMPARITTLIHGSGLASAVGAQPASTKVIAPTSGSISAVGNVPQAIIPTQLHVPDGGAATAVGNAPALSFALAPAGGSISAAGSAPVMTSSLATPSGAASADGSAPAMASALVPETGTVSATGNAPILSIEATSGLVSAIGSPPALASELVTETATILAIRAAPTLTTDHVLTTSGDVQASGAAPILARYYQPAKTAVTAAGNAPPTSLTIAPASGAWRASGAQPAAALTLRPSSGSAAAAGTAPELGVGASLVPQTGLISAIGNAPEIDLPDPLIMRPPSGAAHASGAQPVLAFTYFPPSGRGVWIGKQPQITGKLQSGGICTPPILGPGMKIIDFAPYLA